MRMMMSMVLLMVVRIGIKMIMMSIIRIMYIVDGV